MSLAAIQARLQARVLAGECAIDAHVMGSSPQDVAARLAIYGDAYRARLAEALASNYPALKQLLGPGDFAALAARYIAAHVSRQPSIRYYGDALARFLAADPGYREVPLLAELAVGMGDDRSVRCRRRERDRQRDARPRAARELGGAAFQPPPSRSPHRSEMERCAPALTSDQPRPPHELDAEPQAWLLCDGLQVVFRSLDAAEAAALRIDEPLWRLCGCLSATRRWRRCGLRPACVAGWTQAWSPLCATPSEAADLHDSRRGMPKPAGRRVNCARNTSFLRQRAMPRGAAPTTRSALASSVRSSGASVSLRHVGQLHDARDDQMGRTYATAPQGARHRLGAQAENDALVQPPFILRTSVRGIPARKTVPSTRTASSSRALPGALRAVSSASPPRVHAPRCA